MDLMANGWLPLKTIAIPSGPFAISPKPLTILPSQNCTFFRSTHHIVRVVVLPPSAAPGWGQTREVLHTARPVFAANTLEYFRVGRVFRNENCLENCILNHLGKMIILRFLLDSSSAQIHHSRCCRCHNNSLHRPEKISLRGCSSTNT